MKKWRIHFIPQTHWDKEWYFTKNVSDIFLIDNVDKIYDIYKRNNHEFDKYTYDGQYSIIDDYLKYYPENIYKIKELVENDKLILGPWYTQTDMFNVTGESIVRNLLIGTKSVEKLNGKALNVAYVPDSFGFNANLPQIFKKSNLKAFVFWRGVYQSQLKNGVINDWTGIDGTSFPTYNMYKHGYMTGSWPSVDLFVESWTLDDMHHQAVEYLNNCKIEILPNLELMSKNTNDIILWPFGSDQLPIYDGLQLFIDELNKIDNEHEWVLSDYDSFINEVFEKTDKTKRGKLHNELRFGQFEFAKVHKTITSSRYDIKHLLKDLEYLIYNVTEPLAIMYEKAGGQYPTNVIEINQKKLLECQAHDSAGTCNTDETNNSVIERLSSAIDSLESLNTLMMKRILEPRKIEKNDLAIFNIKPYLTNVKQEITIFTKSPTFKIIDEHGLPIKFTVKNQKYSATKEDNFKLYNDVQFKDSYYKLDDDKGQYWTTIEGDFNNIEGLYFKIFKIQEIDKKFDIKLKKYERSIENDYFKLECDFHTGWINLLNKKTDELIKNAFVLKSQFDAGDSYDFSPSKNNPQFTNVFRSVDSNIYEHNDEKVLWLNYSFQVPTHLDSNDYVSQQLELKIFLKDDDIKLEINIDNKAKDIKWMIECKTNIKSKTSFADTAFGIIERPVSIPEMKIWQKEKWVDCPIEIEAMESVCWLQNKNSSYAISTKGNNEYQIVANDTISLTLFRAYSTIGRPNLAYRKGWTSGIDIYPHETPNANLNKLLKITLHIVINDVNSLVRKAKHNNLKSVYYQSQLTNQYFIKGDRFVISKKDFKDIDSSKIDFEIPDNLVISALKKSYDGTGYILRMYNASNGIIKFKPLEGWIETDLMENKIDQLDEFKQNEVRTFWIEGV